jgi:hypothetical protein
MHQAKKGPLMMLSCGLMALCRTRSDQRDTHWIKRRLTFPRMGRRFTILRAVHITASGSASVA